MLWRIIAAAILVLIIRFLPDFRFRELLYLLPYLLIGYDILLRAIRGIRNGQPFDENFLMAVATLGAMALGDYTEGAAVMLFYQLGELFQSVAIGKSRRSISALMDIRPDSADIERADGSIETVDPDEVEIGSVIVVRPGEKVPIDAVVLSGSSVLDTAALTGESVPRPVDVGDSVPSGCINLSGLLRMRTVREFGESTASKILELVENASSRKSRSENFITKFARIYTPAVCGAALALFLLPPLFSLLAGKSAVWGQWLYRALTFLVISCPCALVISIPLTFFAGLGGASREGVLIKGSNYMETLAQVRTLVTDKTGTMTRGVFEVTELHPVGVSEKELLSLAAHAESVSTHPIAQSIVRAYAAEIEHGRVNKAEEIGGYGITAEVDGASVAVGSLRLMARLGIPCEAVTSPGTVIYAARDGQYIGHIRIADVLKDGAAEAVRDLKKLGIRKAVMLTGDSRAAAEDIACELGIDEYFAELLPADKVAHVEALLAALGPREKLAFVGDGINDAPVLSRADVGISMGALGSDAAIEASDVVLTDDDPRKIVRALAISKKCLRIVYENIFFALGVKAACLLLGALGTANMWVAIFADVGVMVIAVLNAIRALKIK